MGELDKFGKLIAADLRDAVLNRALDLESGFCGSPAAKELHQKLSQLSVEQRGVLKKVLTNCIDSGIHDFLFTLQEKGDVRILVGGTDVTQLSDGLNGEIFSEDGWFERFSQHKEAGI